MENVPKSLAALWASVMHGCYVCHVLGLKRHEEASRSKDKKGSVFTLTLPEIIMEVDGTDLLHDHLPLQAVGGGGPLP